VRRASSAAYGDEEFLYVIRNAPHNDEGIRLLEWPEGEFDAELFGRRTANAALLLMAWNV
jgi:hypothetical protein